MSKKRRKKGHIEGGFCALPWRMANTPAYRKLTIPGRALLPLFLGKIGRETKKAWDQPGYYSTVFRFTYAEARRLGYYQDTFRRGIEDLMRIGFIDPKTRGTQGYTIRAPSEFMPSKRWKLYGTAEHEPIFWSKFDPTSEVKIKRKPKKKAFTPTPRDGMATIPCEGMGEVRK